MRRKGRACLARGSGPAAVRKDGVNCQLVDRVRNGAVAAATATVVVNGHLPCKAAPSRGGFAFRAGVSQISLFGQSERNAAVAQMWIWDRQHETWRPGA